MDRTTSTLLRRRFALGLALVLSSGTVLAQSPTSGRNKSSGPRMPEGRRANPAFDDVASPPKAISPLPPTVVPLTETLLPVLDLGPTTVETPESVSAAIATASAVPTVPPAGPAAYVVPTVPPATAAVIPTAPPGEATVSAIPTVLPSTPVVQAGCASCGTGLIGPATDLMTGGSGECTPGRYGNGDEAYPSHALGRFAYGLYNCLCVPDPCYEPKWTPLADAAFFTPSARPITQTRFRGSLTRDLGTPDRAEYFWAKGVGDTRGPRSADGRLVSRLDDDALTMYTEAATGRVGVYTALTYHRVRPDVTAGASGFGDLVLGTKTLLLDCELLQIAFQMQTTVPTANTEKGLGTGHTTLEPSVILGLKLSPDSYLQAQVGEWIPLGGDTNYAGAAIKYNFSYNHVLCRPLASCPIIGTMEFQGVTFQDGAYTDPLTGAAVRGSGTSYVSIGPGIRAFICDRADFGLGTSYGIGDVAGPRQEYRIDVRVRY